MALQLDASTATMSFDMTGSKSTIRVGTQFALLHGTRNVNLTAADDAAGVKPTKGPSVTTTGKVFLAADPSDFTIGDWEFGMIQVSNLQVYEFVYAGRLAGEGSVTINLKSGFTKNPSLDEEVPPNSTSSTIDATIFDQTFLTATRVTTTRVGFEIEYKLDDHPNTLVPLRFENRKTTAPNFIFSARRDEGFIAYFVARENSKAPIQFLARIGWHAIWHGTFKWSAATMK